MLLQKCNASNFSFLIFISHFHIYVKRYTRVCMEKSVWPLEKGRRVSLAKITTFLSSQFSYSVHASAQMLYKSCKMNQLTLCFPYLFPCMTTMIVSCDLWPFIAYPGEWWIASFQTIGQIVYIKNSRFSNFRATFKADKGIKLVNRRSWRGRKINV